MKHWNLLLVAALILVAFLAHAEEPQSTPITRAKLMMKCDPEMGAMEIAITSLVGMSVMTSFELIDEYDQAMERYQQMKSCKDVENSYEEFVVLAKKFGNEPDKYWLTDEGRSTLDRAAEYLKIASSLN